MTALLEIDSLRIRIPTGDAVLTILDGVSLTVDAGESLALVGESGSGKSMTVRSVLRLLPPRAMVDGEIRVDGRSVLAFDEAELAAFRRSQAAMIFQDPRAAINPVRTVGDFLVEGLRTSRQLDRDAAVTEARHWLEVVGITRPAERLAQYPHEFSGGMLQRLMIASAVASGARLLLADEPTTALDVSIQAEIMGLLAELKEELGLAVLFVTHDIDLAIATSSRIDVMYAGTVVESRLAASLHDAPWHPYSAALIASKPLVDTRVESLRAIAGSPISAGDALQTCAFEPRCAYAIDRCSATKPEPWIGDDGYARCIRVPELLTTLSHVVHPVPAELQDQSSRPVVIEVRHLTKSFRIRGSDASVLAVDDVSLAVREGECLGIVGESGSGKSTLAKLLLGIELPDSGEIEVSGEVRDGKPRNSAERRRRGSQLQVVFQDPFTSLDPKQTPADAVDEIVALHDPGQSREARRERVSQLLTSVGLDAGHAVALPRELSGGQCQRVAIAKALAANPQAIILDEAVSGLDVSVQAQVLNLLSDLQRQTGVAYVFITHDLAVVRQVAHRVVVMREGRVVEAGRTADVLDAPDHEYTRRLRDAAPRPGWEPTRRPKND
jgi:peptide/nickel transport system ATP-binding protein